MEARIDYPKASPKGLQAMYGLERYVRECGLEPSLLELVKMRASQINGCAFCIDMHSKDARAARRERATPVRRSTPGDEAPYYSRSRTGGARLDRSDDAGHGKGTYRTKSTRTCAKHFSEKELVDLTLAAVTINAWNRLAIAFRSVPGSYQAPRAAKA